MRRAGSRTQSTRIEEGRRGTRPAGEPSKALDDAPRPEVMYQPARLHPAGLAVERADLRGFPAESPPASVTNQSGEPDVEIPVIPGQGLIGALSIEHDDHAVLAREAEDA